MEEARKANLTTTRPPRPGKAQQKSRTSNLEAFKEELKRYRPYFDPWKYKAILLAVFSNFQKCFLCQNLTRLFDCKFPFNSMQEEREQRRHLRSQMEQMGMEKEALDRIAPLIDNPYLHGTGEYDNDPNTTNIYLSNLSLEVGNFFKHSLCSKLFCRLMKK